MIQFEHRGVPGGEDVGPATRLALQPEPGRLIDEHRPEDQQCSQQGQLVGVPPRLDHMTLVADHEHANRQRDGEQLEECDECGDFSRCRQPHHGPWQVDQWQERCEEPAQPCHRHVPRPEESIPTQPI